MHLLFHLLELAILTTILVLVIILYINQKNSNSNETYVENCSGMQYYGMPFYDNYNAKICSDKIAPLYPEGGCSIVEPGKVSLEYQEGKFTPAV